MTIWDFADKHPFWFAVYLCITCFPVIMMFMAISDISMHICNRSIRKASNSNTNSNTHNETNKSATQVR